MCKSHCDVLVGAALELHGRVRAGAAGVSVVAHLELFAK